MDLPVLPPVKPMLAKAATKLPDGDGVYYEPKWDGFRCIVFRDGDEVELGSRNERPLTRYFPEVVDRGQGASCRSGASSTARSSSPRGDRLDFEALLQRIHPAASRVQPAGRADAGVVRRLRPAGPRRRVAAGRPRSRERRAAARAALRRRPGAGLPHAVTQDADDRAALVRHASRAPGSTASSPSAADLPYGPDQRLMIKVKHERTADCVVAGFRWHKSGPIVGSLLLGLYDDAGDLHHIGVAASFPMARRAELVEELAPYRASALDGHPWQDWANAQVPGGRRAPDARARSAGGTRRRTCRGCRCAPSSSWRSSTTSSRAVGFVTPASSCAGGPTGTPLSCTYDQLEVPVRYDLAEVLAG